MAFSLGLLDREVVDRGEAPLHQAVGDKFPVFVAVEPKPASGIVMQVAIWCADSPARD
jgi:hypothetical protein